jgi:hypothetical protein
MNYIHLHSCRKMIQAVQWLACPSSVCWQKDEILFTIGQLGVQLMARNLVKESCQRNRWSQKKSGLLDIKEMKRKIWKNFEKKGNAYIKGTISCDAESVKKPQQYPGRKKYRNYVPPHLLIYNYNYVMQVLSSLLLLPSFLSHHNLEIIRESMAW